ncbi:type I restriction endonuclease [Paraflavitalea speifideaquila]|uniref:type I restriction endonuclease n=1 Tax=Paraflavitalea speifideaquila TaxID=3076558 RepID=UPI0028EF3FCC|nr:type I restriction endonuclease [Paraflavitalea speifideiaquila]
MANFISEDQIEKAIIEVFVNNLGYRHLNCFDKDTTGRVDEKDVVIKPLLKQKLQELNKGLPEAAIEDVYNQICHTRLDKSDISANKEIYNLIRNGKLVEVNNAQGKKSNSWYG